VLIGDEVRRRRISWMLQRSTQVRCRTREGQRAFVITVVAG
jgi:hypothetical protein